MHHKYMCVCKNQESNLINDIKFKHKIFINSNVFIWNLCKFIQFIINK